MLNLLRKSSTKIRLRTQAFEYILRGAAQLGRGIRYRDLRIHRLERKIAQLEEVIMAFQILRGDDGLLYRRSGASLTRVSSCELCSADWDSDAFLETCRRCGAVAKELGLHKRKRSKKR